MTQYPNCPPDTSIPTISVHIPTVLRPLTGNRSVVTAQGRTVGEVLKDLERQFPGVAERLLDSNGNLRRFVSIFVNGEDIRFLKEKDTPIGPSDELSIIPAVAGG
ncbi:ubiquitin-like small modifier protein 1 [Candidatus Methylacidithermus pantelleriae]|uniref:Sulfur carrier protein CysO n=1 Tax=Candidatus Methylacidithermus pantelleriae TaxID=2744239 RepID=A0A8J2FP12_9BACT|nr:ubiquitin-like small modifier protein 1 [Candidatus Methylacidithermus pantelleriae]CAF0699175.1 Sulfur carrier protein CysO [Candidatus Methylacidithermus pantelleriae]